MFMCKNHWFSLRRPMRDAIWREYRPGQENDKNPSPRYMAVQRRAVAEVAFKPRDEAAALVCGQLLLESERWRQVAIDRGFGDPLAGLDPLPADVRERLAKASAQTIEMFGPHPSAVKL